MILFNFPIAASKILAVIFLVVISASEVEAKKLLELSLEGAVG